MRPLPIWMMLISPMIAFFFATQSSGAPQINVNQRYPGTRAIGANVTVITTISDGDDANGYSFSFGVKYSNGTTKDFAAAQILPWSDITEDKFNQYRTIDYLDLSDITYDLTRKYMWYFSFLPEDYDNLTLITWDSKDSEVQGNSTLHVSECASKKKFNTTNQSSYFYITSISERHYNDTGTCNCINAGEELFNTNGSKADGIATCGFDATWTGCEDVQCWSGPQNITAGQFSNTVNATMPFNCSFVEGFPNVTKKVFRTNDDDISGNYTLQSADNGKNLTCEVVSKFTVTKSKAYKSPPRKILVYYPPENSTLSNGRPVITVNSSELLNYCFSANPVYGDVNVTVNKGSEQNSSAIFDVIRNHTEGTRYIYKFNITVTSGQDYGSYDVCASTTSPAGKDCANLAIRNAVASTTSQPDTPTFSVTTGPGTPTGLGISATIIGVIIVAGVILLVLIVAGVVLCRRRKNASNKDNGKEEKVNELYGSAQYQASSPENPENVKQEKANVLYGSASGGASGDVVEYAMANPDCIASDDIVQYATSNPDAGNEDTVVLNTSAAEQPCSSSSDVYAQVNKKKGNVNDGYNVEIHDSKPDTSADTYTVIDKSKKRNKDDVPEVYAVVNKPRTKG